MKDLIKDRVHKYFWDDDINCATTTISVLAEYFDIELVEQVIDSTTGLNGAGKSGAQCGLVEGSLMFLGIYGKHLQIPEQKIIDVCKEYTEVFCRQFKSLQCSVLRPGGFNANDPPHLCERLTCEAIIMTVRYIKTFRDSA
ncbi:MAG: C_GCAxxG_C_C family protein [Proteobacteria bacterium]|nr:C_GCAxxG_C_C family protein [Pseudomonadota bacterium]